MTLNLKQIQKGKLNSQTYIDTYGGRFSLPPSDRGAGRGLDLQKHISGSYQIHPNVFSKVAQLKVQELVKQSQLELLAPDAGARIRLNMVIGRFSEQKILDNTVESLMAEVKKEIKTHIRGNQQVPIAFAGQFMQLRNSQKLNEYRGSAVVSPSSLYKQNPEKVSRYCDKRRASICNGQKSMTAQVGYRRIVENVLKLKKNQRLSINENNQAQIHENLQPQQKSIQETQQNSRISYDTQNTNSQQQCGGLTTTKPQQCLNYDYQTLPKSQNLKVSAATQKYRLNLVKNQQNKMRLEDVLLLNPMNLSNQNWNHKLHKTQNDKPNAINTPRFQKTQNMTNMSKRFTKIGSNPLSAGNIALQTNGDESHFESPSPMIEKNRKQLQNKILSPQIQSSIKVFDTSHAISVDFSQSGGDKKESQIYACTTNYLQDLREASLNVQTQQRSNVQDQKHLISFNSLPNMHQVFQQEKKNIEKGGLNHTLTKFLNSLEQKQPKKTKKKQVQVNVNHYQRTLDNQTLLIKQETQNVTVKNKQNQSYSKLAHEQEAVTLAKRKQEAIQELETAIDRQIDLYIAKYYPQYS